jgi:beta-mannosidase
MHAAPVRETLRRTIPQDQLYHHSPSIDHHNKDAPKRSFSSGSSLSRE